MSDPMQSLKHKRAPLPGQRRVPIREPQPSEQAMFEEMTGRATGAGDAMTRAIATQARRAVAGEGAAPAKVGDEALLSSVMVRLASLERQLQMANSELDAKNTTIQRLQDRLKLAEARAATAGGGARQEATESLQREYAAMQRRVHDMETFLADYGMVWVGAEEGEGEEEPLVAEDPSPAAPGLLSGKTWSPDVATVVGDVSQVALDRILENIADLNALAGEGVARVTTDRAGAARLKMPDGVPLTFFKNGVFMFNGPLRPYSDPTTQLLVKDLTDGYFPWELKEKFPDGTPLEVSDRRDEVYEKGMGTQFGGRGHVLGGKAQPSRLVHGDALGAATPPKALDPSLAVVTGNPHSQGSRDASAFLRRLPRSVIRHGKVIDVRGGVAQMLTSRGSKHEVHLVKTDVMESITDNARRSDQGLDRPTTPADIATIRLKSGQGAETYIVKLRFNDTIKTLRRYIDQHRGPGKPEYKLLTSFPRKTLNQLGDTLVESGLTPNATVHIVPRRQ